MREEMLSILENIYFFFLFVFPLRLVLGRWLKRICSEILENEARLLYCGPSPSEITDAIESPIVVQSVLLGVSVGQYLFVTAASDFRYGHHTI
jgi:hypothetical protein